MRAAVVDHVIGLAGDQNNFPCTACRDDETHKRYCGEQQIRSI